MTMQDVPAPAWADWAVRAVIYFAFAALLFWWHPVLGIGAAIFIGVDLTHHAADTARRRNGYKPIPRHPSVSGAPKIKLRVTMRALLVLFGMVALLTALIVRVVLGQGGTEMLILALGAAAIVSALGAVMFPVAAMALLWLCGVSIGFLLSLADLLVAFAKSGSAQNSGHRQIDQLDHRLADLVLGQPAAIPLRADLAERAALDAKEQEGAK